MDGLFHGKPWKTLLKWMIWGGKHPYFWFNTQILDVKEMALPVAILDVSLGAECLFFGWDTWRWRFRKDERFPCWSWKHSKVLACIPATNNSLCTWWSTACKHRGGNGWMSCSLGMFWGWKGQRLNRHPVFSDRFFGGSYSYVRSDILSILIYHVKFTPKSKNQTEHVLCRILFFVKVSFGMEPHLLLGGDSSVKSWSVEAGRLLQRSFFASAFQREKLKVPIPNWKINLREQLLQNKTRWLFIKRKHQPYLGKWSNLTSIFFKRVESTNLKRCC